MSRRRRKMILRYSPYIVIIGLATAYTVKSFAGEIVENIRYEQLQEIINNEKEEVSDNETTYATPIIVGEIPSVAIEAINETVKDVQEEEAVLEEIVEEQLPHISDELLAAGYDFKDINFDELLSLNDDTCAWITIDNTNIDYPLMYAPEREDNYYLHRDLYGKKSSSGTLYIYSENESLNNQEEDISDVTLVFGHHMRGGKMFAQLFNYVNQSYYEQHPFAVIYTPDGYAFKASFFAGIITKGGENENVYSSYFTDEEMYNNFIENLKENSTFTSGIDVNYGDKLIGLVTCEYTGGTNSRYILYGVLEKQYIDELQIDNNVEYQRRYKRN